jgi:predicted transcriptional regulator of viral defense system
MDWAKIIAEEAKTNDIIHSDELAKRLSVPIQTLRVTLRRQEKRGLVERVTRKIYINKLASGFNVRDLATEVSSESYVSLESALNEWGISSQSQIALTCVSPRQISSIKIRNAEIKFRTLKKSLFWGFEEKKTRYNTYKLAEREKALLDWIYLRRKDGLSVELDEFQFQNISRSKLLRYAKQYPRVILQTVYPLLIEHQFAA